jgi:hypothetical protein
LSVVYGEPDRPTFSSAPIVISNLSRSTRIIVRTDNLAEVELSTGEKLNVLVSSRGGPPLLVSANSADRIHRKQKRVVRHAFWGRLIGR